MALNIVTVEQPEHSKVLKTPAQKVHFPLSTEDKELISAMKDKLAQLQGVGLAAPQINFSRRIIAVYIPEEAIALREGSNKVYPMHVMINPTYEAMPGSEITYDFEGCYSVSSRAGKVPRYEQIKVIYHDEIGTFHEQIEQGFYARVLQHEIDHVNGVLITDRLTPDCVQGTVEEMRVLRRAEFTEENKILFDAMMAHKLKK